MKDEPKPKTPPVGSAEYFFEEIVRFREFMGDKKMMYNHELMLRAFKGLFRVYLLTEYTEKVENVFLATKLEFDRRLELTVLACPT